MIPSRRKWLVGKRELLLNPYYGNSGEGWSLYKPNTEAPTIDYNPDGSITFTYPSTINSNFIDYYQGFVTVIGRSYRVRGSIPSAANPGGSFYGIRKADNIPATVNIDNLLTGATGVLDRLVVATATFTYFLLQVNRPASGSAVVTFGASSVRKP